MWEIIFWIIAIIVVIGLIWYFLKQQKPSPPMVKPEVPLMEKPPEEKSETPSLEIPSQTPPSETP